MKQARDSQSLSTFKRDTAKIMRQLKKTGQPVVLTVKGKAELIVQDAESYQRLLERLDRVEAIEGIRRGLESMKRNAGKPAEEFFNEGWMNKASESTNEPITNVPQKPYFLKRGENHFHAKAPVSCARYAAPQSEHWNSESKLELQFM